MLRPSADLEHDLRKDLERRAVAQILARAGAHRLDARTRRGAQFLLRHCFGEARLQQIGQDFLSNLAPNCWRITLIGALPGRKPLSRAVRLTRLQAVRPPPVRRAPSER